MGPLIPMASYSQLHAVQETVSGDSAVWSYPSPLQSSSPLALEDVLEASWLNTKVVIAFVPRRCRIEDRHTRLCAWVPALRDHVNGFRSLHHVMVSCVSGEQYLEAQRTNSGGSRTWAVFWELPRVEPQDPSA